MTLLAARIKRRRSTADLLFDFFLLVLGIIVFVVIAYPLYFVVLASFSDPGKVSNGEIWLWSPSFSTYGYQQVFSNQRIWNGYKNTILYAGLGTLLHLAVTLPAAYTLSRKNVMLRGPITFIFTFVMFFSGGMIPTYFVYRSYHILNTIWVMILPGCISSYHIIMARTFFQSSIPDALLDAAKIDGCSDFRYFLQIVLPLSSAIVAVIALYNIVGVWNSYMNALLYLREDSMSPLQLILREILIVNSNDAVEGGGGEDALYNLRDQVKYSVIVVSTLPLMIGYPFLQKYFNKGVMIGAVKG